MKIKTKLLFNTIISLCVVILMLLSLVWSFRRIISADRDMELVDEMRKVSFERILLRDDYLIHQEERAGVQWHAKSGVLRSLFAQADNRFPQGENRALLQQAKKDFDATFAGFSWVIQSHTAKKNAAGRDLSFNETELRLISQVFLKAYSLSDNIGRLRESVQRSEATARDSGIFMMVFFIICGVVAIIVNSIIISRTLSKRIASLGTGVAIIGAGDLTYRLAAEGDDELSALALASNEMAEKLKNTYTSVENLQKEIHTRKRAEEALRDKAEKLEAALGRIKTLSGLLPICSHCKKIRDEKGYWNQLETYISEHSDTEFSHSICETCLKKYYPHYAEKMKNKNDPA